MKKKSKAGHDVVGIKKTALKAFVYRCTTCLYAFFFPPPAIVWQNVLLNAWQHCVSPWGQDTRLIMWLREEQLAD